MIRLKEAHNVSTRAVRNTDAAVQCARLVGIVNIVGRGVDGRQKQRACPHTLAASPAVWCGIKGSLPVALGSGGVVNIHGQAAGSGLFRGGRQGKWTGRGLPTSLMPAWASRASKLEEKVQ